MDRDTVLGFLAASCMSVAMGYAGASWLNLPIVLVDVNTKQCVAVMLADGTVGSCERMPTKYDRQWVMKSAGH